jgi:hypothetical protein
MRLDGLNNRTPQRTPPGTSTRPSRPPPYHMCISNKKLGKISSICKLDPTGSSPTYVCSLSSSQPSENRKIGKLIPIPAYCRCIRLRGLFVYLYSSERPPLSYTLTLTSKIKPRKPPSHPASPKNVHNNPLPRQPPTNPQRPRHSQDL